MDFLSEGRVTGQFLVAHVCSRRSYDIWKLWQHLFTGDMNRLLTPPERLALKCETGSFICVSTDATLEWIGGISWRGRQYFRASISEVKKILRVQPENVRSIGACETIAAVIAIMIWSLRNGERGISYCALTIEMCFPGYQRAERRAAS